MANSSLPILSLIRESDGSDVDDEYDETCDVDLLTPRADGNFPYLDEVFLEMENDQKTSEDFCNLFSEFSSFL